MMTHPPPHEQGRIVPLFALSTRECAVAIKGLRGRDLANCVTMGASARNS